MNEKLAHIQQLNGQGNDHEQNECTSGINLQYMDKTGSADENLKYVDVHNRIFAHPSELNNQMTDFQNPLCRDKLRNTRVSRHD